MSYYRDVQIAFDKALNSLAGGVDVAWEGVHFEPTVGEAWLRPTLLFSPSSNISLNGSQQNFGIYQIDFFYPIGKGNKQILEKMQEILDYFKSNQELTESSTTILISSVSREGAGLNVDSKLWNSGVISINFRSYILL